LIQLVGHFRIEGGPDPTPEKLPRRRMVGA
jgi:hypothetical protein